MALLREKFKKLIPGAYMVNGFIEKEREELVNDLLTAVCEVEGHTPVLSKELDKLYEDKCARCGKEGGVISYD